MMHCTVKQSGAPTTTCGVAVSAGDKVYAFGSLFSEDQIKVHIVNTVSLRWRTLPPVTTTRGKLPPEVPCHRFGHTAVIIEDIVYLWGGSVYNHTYDNTLYAFDVSDHRWIMTRASGTVPEGMWGHRACVLGRFMYIYGGLTQVRLTNDLYKLDTTTMVWSLIKARGTLPPASADHSATIIGTKMFVFGGNKEIRVFNTETNYWLDVPSAENNPTKITFHSAFNVYNFKLRVWKFSPEISSWKGIKLKEMTPSYGYG